jgi:hypothetical protein
MRILTELHERTCRSGRGPEEQQDGSDDWFGSTVITRGHKICPSELR